MSINVNNNTMTHSAECLRKAVPLMVKYNIAVTPSNYALWYTYVSGNHPKLNEKLNKALKQFGTCPPTLSRELFEEFLSDKDLELYDEITTTISELVSHFQQDVDLTLDNTKDFSAALNECNQDLDKMQQDGASSTDILNLVTKLSEESKAMQSSAEKFQDKLSTAYQEISRLQDELAHTQQAATTDALTGLLNRGTFDSDIQLLCDNNSSKLKLFLTFVDIDHFKLFNDNFGHKKGDKVLEAVADKLLKNSNQLNTPYRFGGEEFCILSQANNMNEASGYAEKIRLDIERIIIKDNKSGKNLHNITASFGVAEYFNETPDTFVEKADSALYKAKENGRNRVELC
ncbi:GGDEF domain-containing protein [Pseudoalteromonas denitrificans]|uniref:diguanylate cyclase n=1 Tax=Pseudoalteromonas denitrificans DSM 6059 TaxID=1123010 RepID=A0A1I1MAA4_9GAMM|nr:GGDEF domain-containing protein [Pseudoalteromonas denitrificans]SFC82135.1 diguanylate cyclase [Pseudoalteromonas denitrificans DSM 6059]